MVSDERTPLLSHVVLLVPKEPGAATVVASGPILPVAAIGGDGWSGLTNRELLAMAQDPFWVRLRTLTFWGFWVCWLVLFVAALSVVFTSPPCGEADCANATLTTTPPATDLPSTVTLEAWTTMVPR
ncbi:uncharacterized protein LOC126468270 [Schistocerca serialis cubense]|uniref:uncharacterized protein LOC126468270 n=1 Tax=Schistocerca serialis cubense TaxID=2023355 RepID=UPI00214E6CFD|nr:uncharacterized protein LOC126468270 [Schistocerca serialis cubense]